MPICCLELFLFQYKCRRLCRLADGPDTDLSAKYHISRPDSVILSPISNIWKHEHFESKVNLRWTSGQCFQFSTFFL